VAEPKPTGNGELRKNLGEKLGKAADKRLEERCEAATVGERPRCKKTTDDGVGRYSEVRRKSSRKVEVSATFAFGLSSAKVR